MEEQDQTPPADNNEKKLERSASYPILVLEKAIDFAGRIYANFSSTQYITREEVASVLKLHPGTVSRDMAACVQYGLLSKSAEGYKITQLFIDIHQPENQNQKKINLLTAFGNPKLNQDLLAKFDGHVIPLEFPNTLIKHHHITEKAAEVAASVFIDSGKFVEAINENRVLRHKDKLSSLQKVQYAVIEEVNPEDKETPPAGEEQGSGVGTGVQKLPPNPDNLLSDLSHQYKKIPIHLTKDKVAYLAYPDAISENDVKILEHQVAGILLRINLENEEKKKE